MLTTKLSSKGQVILPKSVRESRRWPVGTEFMVEETADGVLLRPTRPFAASRLEDVAGCLRGSGPARTIEEMDQAIEDELRDRHDRGRY
jgi:AbrB family looped-hinge helix DNA binding protein